MTMSTVVLAKATCKAQGCATEVLAERGYCGFHGGHARLIKEKRIASLAAEKADRAAHAVRRREEKEAIAKVVPQEPRVQNREEAMERLQN
ncbi:MAG: hypothetical protein WCJ29_04860, partial [bacterium]